MDYIYGFLGIATAAPTELTVKTETVEAKKDLVETKPQKELVETKSQKETEMETAPLPTSSLPKGLEKPVLTREEVDVPVVVPSKEEFQMVLSRMFDVHVNRSRMFEELKMRFASPHQSEIENKEEKERKEELKWCEQEIVLEQVMPLPTHICVNGNCFSTEQETVVEEIQNVQAEQINLNQNPFSEFMNDTMIQPPLPPLPPLPSVNPLSVSSSKAKAKETFTILGRNVLLLKQIKEENEQFLILKREIKEKEALIQSLTKASKHKDTLLSQCKKKMEGVALHAQTVRNALERTVMEQSVKVKEMQIQIRQLEKKHRSKCRDLKIKAPAYVY